MTRQLEIGKLYKKRNHHVFPTWDLEVETEDLEMDGWKEEHIMLYLGENKFWSLHHKVRIIMTEFESQMDLLIEIK